MYPCFPGIVFTTIPHNTLSKPLAAFHITMVETIDIGEKEMNPVTITIMNAWKEY